MGAWIDLWVRKGVYKESTGWVWINEDLVVKKWIRVAFVWDEQNLEIKIKKDRKYNYSWEKLWDLETKEKI